MGAIDIILLAILAVGLGVFILFIRAYRVYLMNSEFIAKYMMMNKNHEIKYDTISDVKTGEKLRMPDIHNEMNYDIPDAVSSRIDPKEEEK